MLPFLSEARRKYPMPPKKATAVKVVKPAEASAQEKKRYRDEDAELMCPICFHTLTDAVQSLCCGNNTCRKCMLALDASKKCPFCRGAFDPTACVPDVKMERRAATTQLPCLHADRGCKFIGDRAARAAHESNECEFIDRRPIVNELQKRVRELEEKARTSALEITSKDQQIADLNCSLTMANHSDPRASLRVEFSKNARAFSSSNLGELSSIHMVSRIQEFSVVNEAIPDGKYTFSWAAGPLNNVYFTAELTVGNDNVSYFVNGSF